MPENEDPHGFTITELLVLLALMAILLAAALPALAWGRRNSQVQESLNNLITLGVAQAIYALDWDGRQCTNVVDDLAVYGTNEQSAYTNYQDITGRDHPPLYLGWCDGGLWAYWMDNYPGNWGLCQPMVWPGGPGHLVGFGAFRVPNCKPFHDYVAGRFYEPTLYAPADWVPYDLVEQAFDDPCEFNTWAGTTDCWWSSYCFSPAAIFHPDVMRAEPLGGWQNPWDIGNGFESPGLWQVRYPDLKTQMLEHHWNQNPPTDPCNPNFDGGVYDGCEPYYFNHALASEPATLFYDLSARLLPNIEAIAADALVMQQTGYGLWSRDTPFGEHGYFGEYGYDLFSLSHHILTTEGILGRDTLNMGAVMPVNPPEDHGPMPRPGNRRYLIQRETIAEPR
ncbi:MAG: hypothetical protein JSV91_12615 [Phycisphaerales bacterium]|nr:MAG: hypothetical protein JSV91_12615 [Phycisphaerales bacterium]